MKRLFYFLILLLILNGCVGVGVVKYSGRVFSATEPENIELVFTEPAKEYIEIGELSGFDAANLDDSEMVQLIKEKASQLGADAIFFRYQKTLRGFEEPEKAQIFTERGWSTIYSSEPKLVYAPQIVGILIKFKENL